MDENYLDNLLNEVSLDKEIDHKIEDDLDSQMAREKKNRQEENAVSKEDIFNMDLEQDASFSALDSDLTFSEEQMDELDKLDNLADLDIGDLDFSDIDFDDVDMTKLDDVNTEDLDDLIKNFEGDLEITDSSEKSEEMSNVRKESEAETDSPAPDLKEDAFDADYFLDSLLAETEGNDLTADKIVDLDKKEAADSVLENVKENGAAAPDSFRNVVYTENSAEMQDSLKRFETNELPPEDVDTLDDLFSLLDMDEEDGADRTAVNPVDNGEKLSDIPISDNISSSDEDMPQTNKEKKSIMQILFGDPDEDDEVTEEELAAIEAKKAAKKAKKQETVRLKKEKADAAKAEKALKNGKKKKQEIEKKRVRAEKRAKRRAEELANAEPEKKLNTPMVVFVFTVFLGGTFLFYMVSNNFNYSQAIEKAANYFSSQKYHKAYDEIKGVEVKEKDQNLKERIYTVMYVERLYESYQSNIKLGRQEKALDSLLRGVDKYYEHYDEAKELGITGDIDNAFSQITSVLENQYGITVERAIEINAMVNYEYVQAIESYVNQQAELGSNLESALPKEQEEEVSK